MFMNGRKERALRSKAFMIATEAAQRAGMTKVALDTLTKLLLHTMKDGLRQPLTGEPPALVETLWMALASGAGLSRVRKKLRPMPPDKESLEHQMGKLKATGTLLGNAQAVGASIAVAVPKARGKAFRMVTENRAVNA